MSQITESSLKSFTSDSNVSLLQLPAPSKLSQTVRLIDEVSNQITNSYLTEKAGDWNPAGSASVASCENDCLTLSESGGSQACMLATSVSVVPQRPRNTTDSARLPAVSVTWKGPLCVFLKEMVP